MSGEEENKTVAVRLPNPLRLTVEKYVERDTHLNSSEFIRAAIREKIKREANGLLEDVIDEIEKEKVKLEKKEEEGKDGSD